MTVTSELTWLIALPLAASPLIYLFGRLAVRLPKIKKIPNPARWLAIVALLADLVVLFTAWQKMQQVSALPWQIGTIYLALDGIGFLMAAVVLGLGFLVAVFSTRYMQGELGEEKFYALLVAMIATMIGLCCTTDLFNLWVWFEAMAVTSYMLVAFYREQPASLEAGFKYLVQSASGSILVVLGISLVFAATGTLDLAMMSITGPVNPMILAAAALFVIGFGVKIALVPVHTWLPDAHSQAPSGISAMLSGAVIETGLIALLRVLHPFTFEPGQSHNWGLLLLGFAALNMLVGNLMALRQTQVKRLLAYSSVSHMGYMLLGVGIAMTYGSLNGASGAFFHLINHAAMKGLAFLSAGALLYAIHLSRGDHDPLVLDDLNGAARRYPLAAFAFSIAVLGLGGLPPLSGFMSKWQIFVSGFETGDPWAIGLVIFAAVNSVLSLGYYAPMVNRLYRYEMAVPVRRGGAISLWMAAPLVVLALAVIILGIYPALANGLVLPAASNLVPGWVK